MFDRTLPALAMAASLGLASAACAGSSGAPEPRKPLDLPRFMGQWFEIYRTPNMAQNNCYAAYQVWSQVAPGKFSIAQTCHGQSATGPERKVMTGARVLDPPSNTKFEASFFAGLFHRDYWVLDHADDYGWMIASTSNGRYVAILARKPGLPRAQAEALKAEVAEMGLDAGKLSYVGAQVD